MAAMVSSDLAEPVLQIWLVVYRRRRRFCSPEVRVHGAKDLEVDACFIALA